MTKKLLAASCALACTLLSCPRATASPRRPNARAKPAPRAQGGATAGRTGARRAVTTDRAPRAIGPYSQAIVAGGFAFASGQIGFDPATGEMVAGGVREQTEQALRNLSAVLEAAGSSLDLAVKTTVFLADMNDFAAMNEVYARHFKGPPPARSTVQAARLPRGALVEIEAIAVLKKR
jgi:2-iminobutanoate/2-iminopropanoate deaminase